MKLPKLTELRKKQAGITHLVVIVGIVVLAGIGGVIATLTSHADSVS